MSKVSPFNGRWGLNYASDFEVMMEDWGIAEEYKKKVRVALKDFGPDRLVEEYHIDNDAGTISRKVTYQNESRNSQNVPFETWKQGVYFDGRPTKSYYGREGGRDDTIVRFEIGNNDKLHFMIMTQVVGNTMISTYSVRGKTYVKKFDRLP